MARSNGARLSGHGRDPLHRAGRQYIVVDASASVRWNPALGRPAVGGDSLRIAANGGIAAPQSEANARRAGRNAADAM